MGGMAGGADDSAALDSVPYVPSRITTELAASRRKTLCIVVLIANLPSKWMGFYTPGLSHPGRALHGY
jgi:hypothetical protein